MVRRRMKDMDGNSGEPCLRVAAATARGISPVFLKNRFTDWIREPGRCHAFALITPSFSVNVKTLSAKEIIDTLNAV